MKSGNASEDSHVHYSEGCLVCYRINCSYHWNHLTSIELFYERYNLYDCILILKNDWKQCSLTSVFAFSTLLKIVLK